VLLRKFATASQVEFSTVRLSAAQVAGSGVVEPATQFVGPALLTPMGIPPNITSGFDQYCRRVQLVPGGLSPQRSL